LASDEARTPPKKGRLGTAGGELYSRPNSKVRLVSMQDLDRRTKAAQVAVETKTNIMADLGGEDRLSTLERIMVENAAERSGIARRSCALDAGPSGPGVRAGYFGKHLQSHRVDARPLAQGQGCHHKHRRLPEQNKP
jgi:hypothetical protein